MTGLPPWLVYAGSTAVALVMVIGLVTLLVIGRPVPDQLWILAGVIGTAYFGGGAGAILAGHQATTAAASSAIAGQAMDTANHAIATVRDSAGKGAG
jgi:hypothetical protein